MYHHIQNQFEERYTVLKRSRDSKKISLKKKAKKNKVKLKRFKKRDLLIIV